MFFLKGLSNANTEVVVGDVATVDFHSHILPALDDGSQSVEMSLDMLRASAGQGVGKIVATPHFYPGRIDPESFFEKRAESANMLARAIAELKQKGENFPEVYLGAEVAFFDGMSRYKGLDRFCINGTRLLLVEMPFQKWTENEVAELGAIKNEQGLIPIIAHIERYIDKQSKDLYPMIFSGDILIQANADAFLERKTRKRMMKMLMQGEVDLLGSDCHNLTTRIPNISEAISNITQYCDEEDVFELMRFSNYVLETAIPIE